VSAYIPWTVHTNHDIEFLTDRLPADRLSLTVDDRRDRATDWGTPEEEGQAPDAVVWPESTEEVSTVLSAATERGVPVTPYAAGTSIEGNPVPVEGGISLDLGRMDAVLDYRPGDGQVDVQPGVLGEDINDLAAEDDLFLPSMPASADISTIGGMVANDSSGMKTVRYGEVGDWVLGLEVVLPDGTVMQTGGRAVKTSSGYNLTDLVVGSEGTLGVVTRATMRLTGRPKQVWAGRATFGSVEDAAKAVADAVRSGVDLAKVELLDELSVRMANAGLDTDLPVAPAVFLEFHATHGVEREVEFCREVFAGHDATNFDVSESDVEMDRLWRARRELAEVVAPYREDLTPLAPGDVTVPISAYPDLIRRIESLAAEANLLVPAFGHAGDGNVHYFVLVDESDPDHVETGQRVGTDIVEAAIDLGGTSTGEHGVGVGKRKHMYREHGEAGVRAMRAVKDALDPEGTMNPGKVFPED
jgi:D-lactate dehydrogenase (cytochrome)